MTENGTCVEQVENQNYQGYGFGASHHSSYARAVVVEGGTAGHYTLTMCRAGRRDGKLGIFMSTDGARSGIASGPILAQAWLVALELVVGVAMRHVR